MVSGGLGSGGGGRVEGGGWGGGGTQVARAFHPTPSHPPPPPSTPPPTLHPPPLIRRLPLCLPKGCCYFAGLSAVADGPNPVSRAGERLSVLTNPRGSPPRLGLAGSV